MILDKKFKQFIMHNIRNLVEKLTMILENINKNNKSYTEEMENMIDYSHLDCLYSIQNETTLNDIEKQLCEDKTYTIELVSYDNIFIYYHY